jgi:Holliday junction resolvasome RuvABC endonuclease subunit
MSRLLALDLSTHVGWALLERGRVPSFGTEHLPPAPVGQPAGRFAHLEAWLAAMREQHDYHALAYEAPILPFKAGTLATTVPTLTLLWGLGTVVELVAYRAGLRCVACPVVQAKITLAGTWRATKDDMVRAALLRRHWTVADHHQADAAAVGIWSYEQIWPKVAAGAAHE